MSSIPPRPVKGPVFIPTDGYETQTRRTLIIYMCILISFGLPVWWQMTQVYRAPLANEVIQRWSEPGALDTDLSFDLHIHLPTKLSPQAPTLITNLKTIITKSYQDLYETILTPIYRQNAFTQKQEQQEHTSGDGTVDHHSRPLSVPLPKIGLDVNVEVMKDVWEGKSVVTKGMEGDWGRVDKVLQGKYPTKHGVHQLFVMCATTQKDLEYLDLLGVNGYLFVGEFRNLILLVRDCSQDAVLNYAAPFLSTLFNNEVRDIVKSLSKFEDPIKPNLDNMRTVKYAPEYQITFCLLNADPKNLQVDWKIDEAVSRYLTPFFNTFANISNFVVNSQILQFASLPIEPKEMTLSDGTHETNVSYFNADMLGRFINSAEWNLASFVSTSPTLHFLLYIPSPESVSTKGPLRILSRMEGDTPMFSQTNAFLVPRWGGIHIKNILGDKREIMLEGQEMKEVVEIWLEQLRGLVGLGLGVGNTETDGTGVGGASGALERVAIAVNDVVPDMKITTVPSANGLTLLELDYLLRKRSLQNQMNTVDTLMSLAKLVDGLGNMVVEDRIGEEVMKALDALGLSHQTLAHSLPQSFEYSKTALVLSEKAFFDPSMVPLLYFPDEHKYAVYMPLFVPCAVPIIVALLKELRGFILRRRERKAREKRKRE